MKELMRQYKEIECHWKNLEVDKQKKLSQKYKIIRKSIMSIDTVEKANKDMGKMAPNNVK